MHLILVLIVMFCSVTSQDITKEMVVEEPDNKIIKEEIPVDIVTTDTRENLQEAEVVEESQSTYGWDIYSSWTKEEKYELAKIVFCEAGNQSIGTKLLVLNVVVNRVASESFPDSIHEVIYEEHNGVYQFSPLYKGGSWYTSEPDEDSWKTLDLFCDLSEDISQGATYFESCSEEDNWHSRNLTFITQSDDIRFYKEK